MPLFFWLLKIVFQDQINPRTGSRLRKILKPWVGFEHGTLWMVIRRGTDRATAVLLWWQEVICSSGFRAACYQRWVEKCIGGVMQRAKRRGFVALTKGINVINFASLWDHVIRLKILYCPWTIIFLPCKRLYYEEKRCYGCVGRWVDG